jgi:hypothetical protein
MNDPAAVPAAPGCQTILGGRACAMIFEMADGHPTLTSTVDRSPMRAWSACLGRSHVVTGHFTSHFVDALTLRWKALDGRRVEPATKQGIAQRRPWLWWRDDLLPLLYLVVMPGEDSPLVGIGDRLRRGTRVVCSRIDSRDYRPDPTETTISDLLNNIVADLSSGRRRVRRIRFPY